MRDEKDRPRTAAAVKTACVVSGAEWEDADALFGVGRGFTAPVPAVVVGVDVVDDEGSRGRQDVKPPGQFVVESVIDLP